MKDKATWSSLVAGSIRRYKIPLDDARRRAVDPPSTRAHVMLPPVDQAVAALIALRGPGECENLFPDIQPLMSKIGWELSRVPASVNAVAMMKVFCLCAFSETMGAPLVLAEFSVDERLDDILAYPDASPQDRITSILICLGYGRVDEARDLPADVDEAASTLIKQLAVASESGSGTKTLESAWDAYLRGFPQAFEAENAEWRHLLLAARLAMGKFGGVPVGEVAERLHRRIKQLAEEESA